MKILASFAVLLLLVSPRLQAQTLPQNKQALDKIDRWTSRDLIQPAALAAILSNKNAKKPLILNIGVVEDIKGSVNVGAASKAENLAKLRNALDRVPKKSFVVVYCGCCPFERCPNIRPAFNLMKDMGFINGKLLNLPENLKQNWINKGYPLLTKN